MSFRVHLRPSVAYLAFLLIGVVAIAFGVLIDTPLRFVVLASGAVMITVLGYPIVLSTICRVPVIAIGPDGVRFPLMGVRLPWTALRSVRRGIRLGQPQSPVLLVFPADPAGTVRAMRPWLRRQGRDELARYGTPIVLGAASLNRPLEDILAAVETAVAAGRRSG
ncbi:hypothetical protein Athai_59370 [Actinocatenispora thailandica]|uniref:PH domain-containing protein n=1 Tax=Actinocatenispora thailandica TaxID=227318 RepID=A0A7R7I0E0_9ACTN|nr:hypothetical protein [Actinocatenispora thailandica]BCJ38434.1 hypothetical protein Athai_59370 [Actinocatenispora thailandica]